MANFVVNFFKKRYMYQRTASIYNTCTVLTYIVINIFCSQNILLQYDTQKFLLGLNFHGYKNHEN